MFWPQSIAFFMYFYYFLAAIVIWLGLQSLLSGVRYSSYVRRECALTPPQFTPFVSVIAPSRGLDPGLKENLTALFVQDYPNYEIVFVTGHQSDP
jgi:cellulose synthase/poly-beta-1,6-N-acetylglucosamine synthase-like glycosyltransferase